METLKGSFVWCNQTARLLGWPVLVVLLFICITKFIFTGTCLSVGYKCKYALGVSEMAQSYLTNLVTGTEDLEIKDK